MDYTSRISQKILEIEVSITRGTSRLDKDKTTSMHAYRHIIITEGVSNTFVQMSILLP